jgi:hypothetical protein
MLFLAAVTSSLSMLFPAMTFIEEALGSPRTRSTLLVVLTSFLGSAFVLYYSNGLVALDNIDFWVGTVLIFVLATVQIICFGWIWGIDAGFEEAHQGARIRIPNAYRFIIKWVTPAYLLVVFGAFCYQSLPDKTAEDGSVDPGRFSQIMASDTAKYTLGLILAIIVALLVLTRMGVQRWKAQGLDYDGTRPAPADDAEGMA